MTILTRLNDYLRAHRRASVFDMASSLDASVDALVAMLATLERKGRVRRLPQGSTCSGSCCKCNPDAVVIYEWVGDGP